MRWLIRTMLAALLVGAAGPVGAQQSLDDMLEPYLTKYQLPALAAAVVVEGNVVAVGAVGTRKAGEKIPVTRDDRFHLGSDTKAMTSLLAAMFVEEGKLRWDSTIAEVLPDLVKDGDPQLKRVTVEQFLSHTSGLPADDDAFAKLLEQAMMEDGNLDEMRAWLVRQFSKRHLASKPGTTFAYANMNFVIVGVMLERISGKTWEELVRERVFEPLGLRSAGLGPQATLGEIDAPLGHVMVGQKPKALLAGPNGDNPPVIGPAGTSNMSVLDFARWAGWHAGEGKRAPALVKPETLRKLHTAVISMPEKKNALPGTPSNGKYALGWGEVEVPWASGPLLYHGGSNRLNLAHIWLEPRRDFAMVTLTNIATADANHALFALAAELYAKFATGAAKPAP